jgi:hypothetical protein
MKASDSVSILQLIMSTHYGSKRVELVKPPLSRKGGEAVSECAAFVAFNACATILNALKLLDLPPDGVRFRCLDYYSIWYNGQRVATRKVCS